MGRTLVSGHPVALSTPESRFWIEPSSCCGGTAGRGYGTAISIYVIARVRHEQDHATRLGEERGVCRHRRRVMEIAGVEGAAVDRHLALQDEALLGTGVAVIGELG